MMQSNTMSVSKIVGTKGSDVFDGTGSALLDLSVRLVRGASAEDLTERIKAMASDYLQNSQKSVADAFVMAFHSRNIRGGKGERDIFQTLYLALNEVQPYLARELLDLVPHYGSWRDVFAMAPLAAVDMNVWWLREAIYRLAVGQLHKDEATEADKGISLCAKWAPRESSADNVKAQWMATKMFPEVKPFSAQMKAYRKLVAGLNRRLDTVETHMCGGSWAAIKPQSVPGRAGKLYSRAFLNLTSTYKDGHREELRGAEARALRKPDDLDRVVCSENFAKHFAAAAAGVKGVKVHGADTLQPHELVKRARVLQLSELSDEAEKDQIRAIWRSLVEKVKGQGGLGRSIMMSDFSGSMRSAGSQGDTPYWVSMALGLLGAECCTDEFKDRFMTFASNPTWHQLPQNSDLFDRLASIDDNVSQGMSTDFQKAMDLVLATLKAQRVRPGEEPENLIVLTDMNWDAACGSADASYYTGNSYRHHVKHAPWETHVEMIRESFKRAGEDMWGAAEDGGLGGWNMPRIVIWNLAANPSNFHATADTPGVAMLSGWSATQFKVLCDVGPRQLTPLEILRVELDDPQYDRVRERVAAFFGSGEEKKHYISHANGFGAEPCSSACSCIE
jgi:hypothetical protein